MATEYLYGTRALIENSVAQSAQQASGAVVYIGTAPVNLVRGYADAGVVNTPIRMANAAEAQSRVGYSTDFESFTVSEAIYGHFINALEPVGPIVVINVLDPDTHRTSAATQDTINFANGIAKLKSDTIIIDTFSIADKIEGVDYRLAYDFNTGTLVATALAGGALDGDVSCSYFEVDPSMVAASDVIGTDDGDGNYTGIKAVAKVYPYLGMVPSVIAAPSWSAMPDVYKALVASSKQIGGQWYAFVLADIPVDDNVKTLSAAVEWKDENGYTSSFSKVFWPMALSGDGTALHLSVLGAVAMMQTDISHDGIPMETPANKPVDIVRLWFGDSSINVSFDQPTANKLTQHGITTAIKWGGAWRLWGDHTAAYTWAERLSDDEVRDIFDVTPRMLMYIANSFQLDWALTIDAPLSRQQIDLILSTEQTKLDALTALGALLGESRIDFVESDNPDSEIKQGNFVFTNSATPTPPMKSITLKVAYTDAGFSSIFEGGE